MMKSLRIFGIRVPIIIMRKTSSYKMYMFKANQLCVPCNSLKEHIICELHKGDLSDHVVRDKSKALVE